MAFRNRLLRPSSGRRLETARRSIPDEIHLHISRRENVNSHLMKRGSYECETCYHRKRSRVSEKRMVTGMFGRKGDEVTGRWRK
jgi:hypothetical protein